MARYAETTKVPISRSKAEVQRILDKAEADEIVTASSTVQGIEAVQFTLDGRSVKLYVRIPEADPREHRRRWRALVLILKAKLELIASGDSTVEREFLADLVLPGGDTLGEHVIPQLEKHYQNPALPLLPKALRG